jgi:hypothetical protein
MKTQIRRRGITLIEVLVIAAIVVVVVSLLVGTLLANGCGIGTSDGERIGTLQKFSHRHGIAFSSYEGEMVTLGFGTGSFRDKPGQLGGAVGDVWAFSILEEDRAVAEKARGLIGRPVIVTYREVNFRAPWKSDTGYRATAIEPLPGQ